MDCRDEDLDTVMLAGAFGTYIDLENAREVNLPDLIETVALIKVFN